MGSGSDVNYREEILSCIVEPIAFLFASTLDRLLFGMRPYWGREEEPLHITFVRQKPKHPLRSLWALLSGRGDIP